MLENLLDTPKSMHLTSLLIAYLAERECSPRYTESLGRTVKRAAAYGINSVCQLTAPNVNKFLQSAPVSSVTRGNYRREILTLWRWAFETGLTDTPPTRVIRIKQIRRPPTAWSRETLLKILEAAENDERPICYLRPNVRWKHALPAWIAISYDTGLRFTDVLNLRASDIRNGCVTVNAHKTGKATVRRLSAYGLKRVAILAKHSPDGTIFRWAMTRRRAFNKWRSFLDELGLDGYPRWFRRSSATYVERKRPGSAPQFLDHSNPALARLHYIDQTLLELPEGPEPLR